MKYGDSLVKNTSCLSGRETINLNLSNEQTLNHWLPSSVWFYSTCCPSLNSLQSHSVNSTNSNSWQISHQRNKSNSNSILCHQTNSDLSLSIHRFCECLGRLMQPWANCWIFEINLPPSPPHPFLLLPLSLHPSLRGAENRVLCSYKQWINLR